MSNSWGIEEYNALAAFSLSGYFGFKIYKNVKWHIDHRYWGGEGAKKEEAERAATAAEMKKDVYNIFSDKNVPRNEKWKKCMRLMEDKYSSAVRKYNFNPKVVCDPPFGYDEVKKDTNETKNRDTGPSPFAPIIDAFTNKNKKK